MIEIFKTKSYVNPDFMTESIRDRNVSYYLHSGANTLLPGVRTTTYGIETARIIVNKVWQVLPVTLKSIPSIESLKRKKDHATSEPVRFLLITLDFFVK